MKKERNLNTKWHLLHNNQNADTTLLHHTWWFDLVSSKYNVRRREWLVSIYVYVTLGRHNSLSYWYIDVVITVLWVYVWKFYHSIPRTHKGQMCKAHCAWCMWREHISESHTHTHTHTQVYSNQVIWLWFIWFTFRWSCIDFFFFFFLRNLPIFGRYTGVSIFHVYVNVIHVHQMMVKSIEQINSLDFWLLVFFQSPYLMKFYIHLCCSRLQFMARISVHQQRMHSSY